MTRYATRHLGAKFGQSSTCSKTTKELVLSRTHQAAVGYERMLDVERVSGIVRARGDNNFLRPKLSGVLRTPHRACGASFHELQM